MSNVTGGNNIAKVLIGIFLLAVLFDLFGSVPSVIADTEPLRWTRVNIPAGDETGDWVLASGSDIQRLVMAGDGTLYASLRGLANTLYRSTNGGLGWTSIGNVHDAIVDIAVSPGDPNKIYFATSSTVYRSVNGGRSFGTLPPGPGGAGTGNIEITSLAVTSLDNSLIAVSTRSTDSHAFGGVFTLDEGHIIPEWANSGLSGYDVYGVAFSPNYATNRQLIALATDETDTYLISNIASSGWSLDDRAKLGLGIVPVARPAIAFPTGYDADPASGSSAFFAGIDTGAGNGDVFKIDFSATEFNRVTDLDIGGRYGQSSIDIGALTAAGDYPATSLIASEADSMRVYASTDEGRSWNRCRKEPSGEAVTCLLAAPDFTASGIVYAATGGAGSALSVSRDTGTTWNQVSLIDTTIDAIVDMAPSPRYAADHTLFMITFGGSHSLWRSQDEGHSWERVLAGTMKLVALPPSYGDTTRVVFVGGETDGGPAIWQSTDDGQTFRCRMARDPATGASLPIDAWAVIDDTSLFIGSYNGSESKIYLTNSGGFTFNEGMPLSDQPLNSLALSPSYALNGGLLAGDIFGRAYLSTDNGSSFQPLPHDAVSPPLSGPVAVAFDPAFDQNHMVYAADSAGIYRFSVTADQAWSNIDDILPAGAANRLVLGEEGTLYAANLQANGGMERCLFPTASTNVTFETVTRYLDSGATLSGLWLSDHHLWSIDTTNVRPLTFQDTLTAPVAILSPADNVPGIGSISGGAAKNIELDWTALEGATSYQWQCTSGDFSTSSALYEGTASASSVRLPALETATAYRWRVRAGAPLLSPWSAKWAFTTGLDTEAINLKPESPAAGAVDVSILPAFQWTAITGASAYELLVATDADYANPAIMRTGEYAIPANAWQCDVALEYGTTYYWKVRAVTDSTYSDWSATGVFLTAAPPETAGPVPVPALVPALDDTIPTEPTPAVPAQMQMRSTPAPQPTPDISTIAPFNQPFEMPAWLLMFIGGLLAVIFLALLVILVMVVKIRRF